MVAVSAWGDTVYTKYVDPAQNTAKVVPRNISAGIAWYRGDIGEGVRVSVYMTACMCVSVCV